MRIVGQLEAELVRACVCGRGGVVSCAKWALLDSLHRVSLGSLRGRGAGRGRGAALWHGAPRRETSWAAGCQKAPACLRCLPARSRCSDPAPSARRRRPDGDVPPHTPGAGALPAGQLNVTTTPPPLFPQPIPSAPCGALRNNRGACRVWRRYRIGCREPREPTAQAAGGTASGFPMRGDAAATARGAAGFRIGAASGDANLVVLRRRGRTDPLLTHSVHLGM